MTIRLLAATPLALLVAALSLPAQAEKKPLKVYILAGQSNMVGMGSVTTFPAIGMDPKTAPMLADMLGKDGKPVVCEDVYITRAGYGEKSAAKHGKLDVHYGGGQGARIGPEYTFGIYAHKMLGEPVLLIKTAWGGKDLIRQFRPPSAGPYPISGEVLAAMKADGKDVEAARAQREKETGAFYRMMMDHVKKVLLDPKAVYPGYDPQAGYELAGFAWFQGYNDYIGGAYPYLDESKGKESARDCSEYTRLLACFIRDIRKELNAPKLPFVIGVFGMDGKDASEKVKSFRKSQAATAEMPEFQGNVVNVFTEEFWPGEVDRLKRRKADIVHGRVQAEGKAAELVKEHEKFKGKERRGAEAKAILDKLDTVLFTPEELKLLEVGVSQQSYHYWGSAKFYAQAGKAFAEAVVGAKPAKPAKS